LLLEDILSNIDCFISISYVSKYGLQIKLI